MSTSKRDTLAWLVALAAAPFAGWGQPAGKVARLGWLSSSSYIGTAPWDAFVAGMRERGWMLNRDFTVDNLTSEGHNERMPALAAELVQRKAFAAIAREKADAVLILGQPFMFTHGEQLAKLTIEHRLPAIIAFAEVARAGVLMAYGERLIDAVARVPHYVDRILRGAKPSELPVEQGTRFYLTLNRRTAQAIGLVIPPSLLLRADEVVD